MKGQKPKLKLCILFLSYISRLTYNQHKTIPVLLMELFSDQKFNTNVDFKILLTLRLLLHELG